MNDKGDNLGDFLRKKFADFDQSSGSWGKPDRAVRKEVLRQITTPVSPSLVFPKILWIASAGLVLLSALGYIGYLHHQLDDVQTTLDHQSGQLEKINQEVVSLTQKHAEEIAVLSLEKEQLSVSSQHFFQEKSELEQAVQRQQSSISRLKKENQRLQQHSANYSPIPPAGMNGSEKENGFDAETERSQKGISGSGTTSNEEVAGAKAGKKKKEATSKMIAIQNIPSLSSANLSTHAFKLPPVDIATPVVPLRKRRSKFEIGYEYSLQSLKFSVYHAFENQRSVEDKVKTSEVASPSHAVQLGWSPIRNWWLRAGIRTASLNIQLGTDLGLAYDKSKEYVKPNREIGNELLLTTGSPYREVSSAINIAFPQGRGLEAGEYLGVRITDNQDLRYYQVPVGIEYFPGSGRLQWLLQGGLQWNKLVFGDYTFDISLMDSRREVITVDRIAVLSKDVLTSQFMSTYAGLGLNYRLFGHWHARAAFAYQYNFNKTTKFSNSTKAGTAFKLGLNYGF